MEGTYLNSVLVFITSRRLTGHDYCASRLFRPKSLSYRGKISVRYFMKAFIWTFRNHKNNISEIHKHKDCTICKNRPITFLTSKKCDSYYSTKFWLLVTTVHRDSSVKVALGETAQGVQLFVTTSGTSNENLYIHTKYVDHGFQEPTITHNHTCHFPNSNSKLSHQLTIEPDCDVDQSKS